MKHIPYSLLFCLCFGIILTSDMSPTHAQETHAVIINEVQISGGIGHTNDDFIELYNTTDAPVDITDWQLRKKTKTDVTSTGISLKTFSTPTDMILIIPAKGYFLWTNSTGAFKSLTDAQFVNSSTIADDNSIALFDATNILIDAVTWGTGHTLPFLPSKLYALNPPANTSIERDTISNTFVAQIKPTPQNTASIQNKPLPPPVIVPINPPIATPVVIPVIIPTITQTETSIRINEILPNPSDTEEFIELFNFGNTDINLKNWSLHDASKTGKYIFKEDTIIQPQSYLTLMRSTFSFVLNNTNETVTLLNPQGAVVDTVSYLKSTKDVSYNFSSSEWRWSSIITPNAINQFVDMPPTKTIIPQNIYVATPATFTAKTSGASDVQYLWNFGDKHTSRLAQATHTYAKKGTYTVILTTLGSLEETVQTFTIHVKKQPKYMVVITEINPNPSGTDVGSEYIILKNTGTKKVNLLNWSIATGTQKTKLANHPITKSLTLKPQETRIIKNTIASFSLPNKEGFVEIRQPNKKVVDAVHYSKSTSIAENEVYQKSPNNEWIWIQNGIIENNTGETDTSQTIIQTTDTSKTLTLENLSLEELSLLKSHIDELILAASQKESVSSVVLQNEKKSAKINPSQENIDSTSLSQRSSNVKTCEHNNVSIDPQHISIQTLSISMQGTSLLNQEIQQDTMRDTTQLLQRINQTLGSFWKK